MGYIQDIENVSIPSLKSFKGKNILVTGATGLIGSTLVEILVKNADKFDYQVYAGCRSKESFSRYFVNAGKRLHFLQLDVQNPIQGNNTFHYIVHAASGAAPVDFNTSPVAVMKANILGTANLLEYGEQHGLERFLFISTGEVYGVGDTDEWKEEDSGYVNPMSARSCYPNAKRAAETLCASYAHQYGLNTVVARICHVYGPNFRKEDNRAYAQFIRDGLQKKDVILKSRGEQYRSWIYVVDCCSALLHILVNGRAGEAYNVADDSSNCTIYELAEIIARHSGVNVRIEVPENDARQLSTPIKRAIFNIDKVVSLGWQPQVTLSQGIQNTISHCLEKTLP